MAFTEEGRRTQQKWMVEREQVEESHATLPLQLRPPPLLPPPRAQEEMLKEKVVFVDQMELRKEQIDVVWWRRRV